MRSIVALATFAVIGSVTASAQIARPGTLLLSADCIAVAADSQTSAVLMLDSAQQLFVSASDDRVLNWSAATRMDGDSTGAPKSIGTTSLRVIGSNVFASWLDARDGTNSVWFNHSVDGGLTWAGAQRIDDGTVPGTGDVRGYRMEVTSGSATPSVYFLLRLLPPGLALEELRFVANDGTGINSFLPAVDVPAVGPQVGSVNAIDLCAEGNTLHVAWEDNRLGLKEVWYQQSIDRGQTWAPLDLQVTAESDQTSDSDAPVTIACAGQTIAIGWEERDPTLATPEIRVAVSADGGATFGPELRVGEYDSITAATTPDVTVFDTGNVSIAWQDARNGTTTLYVATSQDQGASFGADVLLSPSGGMRVHLDSDGDFGVGCWVSGADKSQGAYSLDNGLTWKTLLSSSATPVTKTACALNSSSGAIGEGLNVVQAWVLDDAATGTSDVYVGGYSACEPSSVVNRNAGINPQSYTLDLPVLGSTFDATVDLSTTNHAMAAIVGFAEPLTFPQASGYVVLVNFTNPRAELVRSPLIAGPQATFSLPIPNDPSLCGFDIFTQALHLGGGQPLALSNAQDAVIGSF